MLGGVKRTEFQAIVHFSILMAQSCREWFLGVMLDGCLIGFIDVELGQGLQVVKLWDDIF